MFHALECETADELWCEAASWFLPAGCATSQPSRSGDTSEVLRASLTIRNPRQRWIASRSPALNPAFAIAEVIWIMAGREDSRFLNYFNRSLPKYAGLGETYHGAYGFRLRKHFGIDQLERAFSTLKADPSSRQVVLQIWDSGKDLPQGAVRSAADIPCNVAAFLKVRESKLEWTQVMRSNDLFRGLPHNIVQFSTLQEIIAGWLGLEPSAYNHFSDSLHLYQNDGAVEERIIPVALPPNTDSIAVPKEESEQAFKVLSDFIEEIIQEGTTPDGIMSSLSRIQLIKPFANMAALVAADALRRRKSASLMEAALNTISNRCFQFMYRRYVERVQSVQP